MCTLNYKTHIPIPSPSFSMQSVEFRCMLSPLELESGRVEKSVSHLLPGSSCFKEKPLTGISLGSVQWELSCISLLLTSAHLFSAHCLSFRMPLKPLQKVLLKHLSILSSCPLRTTWTREYPVARRVVFLLSRAQSVQARAAGFVSA